MVKEVNPRIHVSERDYPVDGHHCSDPEKARSEEHTSELQSR